MVRFTLVVIVLILLVAGLIFFGFVDKMTHKTMLQPSVKEFMLSIEMPFRRNPNFMKVDWYV